MKLTPKQLAQLDAEGYVVVENLLDPVTILQPVIDEYALVLDNLAQILYDEGKIPSRFEDLPFNERFIKICHTSGQVHNQFFDFSLPFQDVKVDTPFWTGPAVFNTLIAPPLLDAVESIIGPEIYSNPVQHVRIKPPEQILPKNQYGNPILGATQWHQDNGVVTAEADDTDMLTVWFSLQDAPLEKGPLKVVPLSHRQGLLAHCPDYHGNGPKTAGAQQIPEKIFAADKVLPLPVKAGDVIFLTRHTVHGSLSNTSEDIRFSFDLRYQPIGQPTGRRAFPGFVARSRANPQSELRDPKEWTRLWTETRAHMATVNQGGQTEYAFRRHLDGQAACA